MEPLDRLHQAIDYLKDKGKIHKQQDIADKLGIGKSYVSEAIKGKPRQFTKGFLARFASAYSEYINEEWLLTGEGVMAKNMTFSIPAETGSSYLKLVHQIIESKSAFKPHIEAKASAGFMDGFSEGDYGRNMRSVIEFFPQYDFTIEVQGDSMLPDYAEGDILACRISTDRINPPIGKVCVIDSKDGPVVKEIKAVNRDSITLHSLNPRYRDYKVDFDNINQIAVVVGSIRPGE